MTNRLAPLLLQLALITALLSGTAQAALPVSATLSGDTAALSATSEQAIQITLSAQGTDYPLNLTPSAVTSSLTSLGRRYFQGTVEGDANSWVRASWANGELKGHMLAFGELMEISTNSTATRSRVLLKKIEAEELTGEDRALVPPTIKIQARKLIEQRNSTADASSISDVLRLGIIVDSRFDSYYKGKGREQALDIINAVDALYQAEFGLAVRVEAINLLTSTNDPFLDINGSLETLLRSLRTYTSQRAAQYGGLGVVHLFSGSYDDNNIIGLSWIDAVCRDDFYNVSVSTPFSRQMLLAAHEIAHNLGARHDDDASCEVETDQIMWPNISSATEASFSDCTKKAVVSRISGTCHLANVDAAVSLHKVASADGTPSLMIRVRNNDSSRTIKSITSQTVLPETFLPATIPDNCSFLGDTLACEHGSIVAGAASAVLVGLDGTAISGELITASATPSAEADLYTLNNYASIDMSNASSVTEDAFENETQTASAASGGAAGAGAVISLLPILGLTALRRRESNQHR